jgi:predicted ATP-dependent endonuclease of OLD family
MKLKKVAISNYKSIEDASFPIDQNLTTLVGANEHGKTNLLKIVRLLDFKTAIENSDKRICRNPILEKVSETKITYELTLSDDDAEALVEKINSLAPQESETEITDVSKIEDGGPTENIKSGRRKLSHTIEKNIELAISYHDGSVNNYSIVSPADLVESKEAENILLEFLKEKLQNSIFYFDTFQDQLEHRISKEIITSKNNDVVNGLIKLAGLTGNEATIFDDTSGARQLRRNGAEELTKQLKRLWIQGKEDDIKVVFGLSTDGNFLNVDIEDFNTYGDISTRSRGFLFFLAFILKFKEYYDGDLKNFIFLIDEPGIFLHPRGQKDLLLYLENLSQFNQMIYTTHSPFMINRLKNFRVRVVSKDRDKGTQIDVKPYNHNWKSLRASLGMMLADSFYYADNNLSVEGPSDRLYILTLLKIFQDNEIINADLNILSIIDSGGAANISSMCRIIKSEERPYVVLVDSDKPGKRAKSDIIKFTEQEKVKEVSDFKVGAVTLEDLLPKKYLINAINKYIEELANDGVCSKPNKIFEFNGQNGIMKGLEEYIVENNLGIEELSKLNIARHFEEELSSISADSFNKKEIKDSQGLIKWLIEALKISISAND